MIKKLKKKWTDLDEETKCVAAGMGVLVIVTSITTCIGTAVGTTAATKKLINDGLNIELLLYPTSLKDKIEKINIK